MASGTRAAKIEFLEAELAASRIEAASLRAQNAELREVLAEVLQCKRCKGPMKLMAIVSRPASIATYLAALGEPLGVPDRSPSRGPPYWKSTVLRRMALGHDG